MLKAIGGFFSRWFESVSFVLGDAKRMYKNNKIKVLSLISVYFLIYAAYAYVGGLVFGFIFYLSSAFYLPLVIAYVARGKEGRVGNWAWEKRANKPKSVTGRVFGFVGDAFKTVLKPFLIVFGFLKKLFGNSPVAVAVICFWFVIYFTAMGFFSRFVPELLGPLGSVIYEQLTVAQSVTAEYPITQAWLTGISSLNMTNFWMIVPIFAVFTFFVVTISTFGFIKALKDGGGFRAVMAYSVNKSIKSFFTIIALIVCYFLVSRICMAMFFGVAWAFDIQSEMIAYPLALLRDLMLGAISMFGVLAMISVATKDKPLKAE